MGVFRTSYSREVLGALIERRNAAYCPLEQQVSITTRAITEISLPVITLLATAEGALFGASIIFTGINGAERVVDCVSIVCRSVLSMLFNPLPEEL